jgi:hypothetical protein
VILSVLRAFCVKRAVGKLPGTYPNVSTNVEIGISNGDAG